VITSFQFGNDLCVSFPAKRRESNHGSVLEQVGHPENEKRTVKGVPFTDEPAHEIFSPTVS
jgi:hypothetical protein